MMTALSRVDSADGFDRHTGLDSSASTRTRTRRHGHVSGITQIGYYRLERTLGKGNFAVVKLATHVITKTKVALKIIDKLQLSEENRVKIEREIHIMKLLDHQHIMRLYEVIEIDNMICLVMEYAMQGELFDYLVSRHRLKESEARSKFKQILSAVAYCHARSIVHRDLKAENLLLDADYNVKVADFGFGNVCGKGEFLKTHCGSPPYAAPELFAGREYDGQKADIWSIGIVLYVLVCGVLPFEGSTLHSLRSRIMRGKFQVPFFVSTECEDLLRHLLVLDPTRRYDFNKIISHRWMTDGSTDIEFKRLMEESQDVALDLVERPIDSVVLARMKFMGMDPDQVKQSLSERQFNSLSTIYHLLVESRRKNPSDWDGSRERIFYSNSILDDDTSGTLMNYDALSPEEHLSLQAQCVAVVEAVSTSSAASKTTSWKTTLSNRYVHAHGRRKQPIRDILDKYEQKPLGGARRMSYSVRDTVRHHRQASPFAPFSFNRRASDCVTSLKQFNNVLQPNNANRSNESSCDSTPNPSCSALTAMLPQECYQLQRQAGLHNLRQDERRPCDCQSCLAAQHKAESNHSGSACDGLFYFPTSVLRQRHFQVTCNTPPSGCLHRQMQQLNLHLGNQRPMNIGTFQTMTANDVPSSSSASSSAAVAVSCPPSDLQHWQQQQLQQTGIRSSFQQSTVSATNHPCFHSPIIPQRWKHSELTSCLEADRLPERRTISHQSPTHRPTFQTRKPLQTLVSTAEAGTSRFVPFEDERRRRCSLPVMMDSAVEDEHHRQLVSGDDHRLAWKLTRSPTASSSGYNTAMSLSGVASRKTSTASDFPDINLDRDDRKDDDRDYDEVDVDDDSFNVQRDSSLLSIANQKNSVKEVDAGEGTEVMSVDDVGSLSLTESVTAGYGGPCSETPQPIASRQFDLSVSEGVESNTGPARHPEVPQDNSRTTSKSVNELIGEVLVTLDANVAKKKLAYWTLPSGRGFVVRHQYVTLALDVRPLHDDCQGPGQLHFRQLNGDVYCYRLLRDELISRILL